jgi:hypothetical protein
MYKVTVTDEYNRFVATHYLKAERIWKCATLFFACSWSKVGHIAVEPA